MYRIYKLILNDEIVYIGKTKRTLKQRKNNGYINEILNDADIELIEETDDISRERYWITYYLNNGVKLLNIKKGDGLDHKKYNKEYREKNKEKIIENIKEYREKNLENYKEYLKEYREKNKDYYKEYYEKNKEHLKEYNKKYWKEYYEKNKYLILSKKGINKKINNGICENKNCNNILEGKRIDAKYCCRACKEKNRIK
jgi:hypothetical protein